MIHSTAEPHGRSPRAKYASRSDSRGKIPSRAIRNVQGLPKAVGLPFPRKRQEKKRKKIAKKSSRKLIQESQGRAQVQGCRGIKARPSGAIYIDCLSGAWPRGACDALPLVDTQRDASPALRLAGSVERATLKRRLPHVGAGRSANPGSRECQKSEEEKKKKKPHTHRPKKTEVSLLISRQPRYAGRARGFQRARLAWTFGEDSLESPPSPRESPQPFPGSAQGMAVQAPGTSVCSPILHRMATFCGWGGPAHLRRPQTLSNRTSRMNAIPAL